MGLRNRRRRSGRAFRRCFSAAALSVGPCRHSGKKRPGGQKAAGDRQRHLQPLKHGHTGKPLSRRLARFCAQCAGGLPAGRRHPLFCVDRAVLLRAGGSAGVSAVPERRGGARLPAAGKPRLRHRGALWRHRCGDPPAEGRLPSGNRSGAAERPHGAGRHRRRGSTSARRQYGRICSADRTRPHPYPAFSLHRPAAHRHRVCQIAQGYPCGRRHPPAARRAGHAGRKMAKSYSPNTACPDQR